MKRELMVFILMLLVLAFAACDMLSPEPYEPALISVRMAPGQRAGKAAGPVEKVWVMVVDYNPYTWSEHDDHQQTGDNDYVELFRPDENLYNLFHHWDTLTQTEIVDSAAVFRNNLDRKDGWREYLGKMGVSPINDLFLTVVDDTARGTFVGVEGMNWLIIGFEDSLQVSHFIQNRISATPDSVTPFTFYVNDLIEIPQRPDIDLSRQ